MKVSWGQIRGAMVSGFGLGPMNTGPGDTYRKRFQDVDSIFPLPKTNEPTDVLPKQTEDHFLYRPGGETPTWAAVYIVSKYKDDGSLQDTSFLCGVIAKFFADKRPPTLQGTPWTVSFSNKPCRYVL